MKILVTGGTGGLGSAIVELLAGDPGNQVYFSYRSAQDKAAQLMASFGNVEAIRCDFSDPDSLQSFLNTIDGIEINALVNNAAEKFIPVHAHKLTTEMVDSGFQHNVISSVAITNCLIKKFRTAKWGRIITILSSALVSNPATGWAGYIAEKNYLLSMSRSWATENIRFNITSNCISPSFMKTDFTSETDARIVDSMLAAHPLKRFLEPSEVAALVADLLRASPFLNGQHIVMNAGEVM
jgi:3-oxoacyl-[acyl-carrier protein] reductase